MGEGQGGGGAQKGNVDDNEQMKMKDELCTR